MEREFPRICLLLNGDDISRKVRYLKGVWSVGVASQFARL